MIRWIFPGTLAYSVGKETKSMLGLVTEYPQWSAVRLLQSYNSGEERRTQNRTQHRSFVTF